MGEHATVYGRPAIVTTVGLRLCARMTRDGGRSGVDLELPTLQTCQRRSWAKIVDTATDARRLWQRYDEDPGPATFAALHDADPVRLCWIALGETVLALAASGTAPVEEMPSLHLRVDSELPVGSGFGSSAAAALAIASAAVATLVGHADWGLANRITLQVERRQHGAPSGVDAATVYHGGVIYASSGPDAPLAHEPLAARPEIMRAFRIFDTGAPAQTTGAVVAAVRARRDGDRDAFDQRLGVMEDQVVRLRKALVDRSLDLASLLAPIRRYHRCLQELGVVPKEIADLIERVEAMGGAAKISGAGSLSGPGAGSLLVVHPQPEQIREWSFLGHLMAVPVALGVEGARLESIA